MKEKLKYGWNRLTADWRPNIEQAVAPEDIDKAMRQSSIPSFGYFFLLMMSGTIATFGLLSNSAPAIIGAMIIAPLMSPIMSLAHGLVNKLYARIVRSSLTITSGVILVIFLSYAFTEAVGISIAGSEILSRTQPTTLDLGVAIAAGAAAAFAYSRASVMNSIAGVAIAVALVPPLAVVGIGISIDPTTTNTELDYALRAGGLTLDLGTISGGAFLLFLTNLVAIVVSAGVVMIFQHYGSIKKGLVGISIMVAGLFVLLTPLGESLNRIYVESQVQKLVGDLARSESSMRFSRGWLESLHARYIDDRLYLFVKAVVAKDNVQDAKFLVGRMQRLVSNRLDEPVQVQLTLIPIDLEIVNVGGGQKFIKSDMQSK